MPKELLLGKGFVLTKDTIYVTAAMPELEDEDVYHAIMFKWSGGKWAHWKINDRIVRHLAIPGPQGPTMFTASVTGRVQVGDKSGFRWEMVDRSESGPSALRMITTMSRIGDSLYVAGMARQVYRRPLGGGPWQRADNGVLVPRDSTEIAGFKSIHGLSEDDLYAAGFNGQIWHRDHGNWMQVDSPTNVKLESVLCVSEGCVFIAGGGGLVLKGSRDSWEPLINEATGETFWCIEKFGDELMLATNQGALFRIENDEVVPLEIALDRPVTTNWLHANDDVLLSVGTRDVLMFDGSAWTEIPSPWAAASE